MLRLAEYSRDCLRELRADTGIQYEARTRGTLQLFRTAAQYDAAQRDIQVLDACGVPYELLDSVRLQTAEPALARSAHKLAGGRSEEHTSDLQSLMRISYAVFCLK